MEVFKHSPYDLFGQAQRFEIPIFQRRYVWTERSQWAPLWADVVRLATRVIDGRGEGTRPHFLGAIVLQQVPTSPSQLARREVIDGQQRLTTLQILFDAVSAACQTIQQVQAAENLRELIENPERRRTGPEDRFKLLPSNRDRGAYLEVMAAEPPVAYGSLQHKDDLLVGAHRYFATEALNFLRLGPESEQASRANALEVALSRMFMIVSINLDANENAQEIFETLNSRGARLSSVDLIKNYILQAVERSGEPVEKAYEEHWSLFEQPFWEAQVGSTRRSFTRAEVFFAQFLVSRLGRVVPTEAVFRDFREYSDASGLTPFDLLIQICELAHRYQAKMERAVAEEGSLDPIEEYLYRMQAMSLEAATPLVLQILDNYPSPIPPEEGIGALRHVESWLVRRALMQLTSKNMNQLIPDVVKRISEANRVNASSVIETMLQSFEFETNYWPDDSQLAAHLATAAIYRRLSSPRRRMLLEAIEDALRGFSNGSNSGAEQRCPRGRLSVEHLIPQKWEPSWPVATEVEREERRARIDRLGNLTLLTQKLNSSVSNGPWLGAVGKQVALHAQSVLKLNAQLATFGAIDWTHESVDARTSSLTKVVCQIWPVPVGHKVEIRVERSDDRGSLTVTLLDLVSAGYLSVGDVLHPDPSAHRQRWAKITDQGRVRLDNGDEFSSPSGAGRHIIQRACAGWHFWKVQGTGLRLLDLREMYRRDHSLDAEGDEDDAIENDDEI